jgi:hypothetical protein
MLAVLFFTGTAITLTQVLAMIAIAIAMYGLIFAGRAARRAATA